MKGVYEIGTVNRIDLCLCWEIYQFYRLCNPDKFEWILLSIL